MENYFFVVLVSFINICKNDNEKIIFLLIFQVFEIFIFNIQVLCANI